MAVPDQNMPRLRKAAPPQTGGTKPMEAGFSPNVQEQLAKLQQKPLNEKDVLKWLRS